MLRSLILMLCVLMASALSAEDSSTAVTVQSPNGRLNVSIFLRDQKPYYSVTLGNTVVLEPSRLGLEFKRAANMSAEISELRELSRRAVDTAWEQPWGERRAMREHYQEAVVAFERSAAPRQTLHLRVRVFNDGLGIRYEMPAQPGLERVDVMADMTEFAIAEASTTEALHIYGEMWNRYEHLYRRVALPDMQSAATPVTFRREDGLHLSIHEAALIDWAGFTLVQRHNPPTLRTQLTPWSDGVAVKATLPFQSSWRTLQVAESAAALLNSDLILNLNEPNALGDVSYVTPGKYTGVWWEMHRGEYTWGSGPRHGATNDRVKARIDFAADYGFDGVLVEGWNIGWDGNWIDNGALFSFTDSYPDFDMPALSAYARERGVKLIGHHETSGNIENYEAQMEAAYTLYAKHGYEQIKTGYVAWAKELVRHDDEGLVRHEWHDGQWAVNHYLRTVLTAAKHQLAINTHEPVKDTGLRRTYPNWLSREGARGQEFNSPGAGGHDGEGINTAGHNLDLVFTRMLAGPMDFTPGIFDLHYEALDTPTRVKSTLAHQLALYVVLYSPIQMVPDYRSAYERYPDAFQFIRDVPTDWEQSIALAAAIDEYVVWARQARGGDDWYIGAISGEREQSVDINLDFLPADQRFVAHIYRDGDDAHWDTDPFRYVIETRVVTAADTLSLELGRGGGVAIRLTPQSATATTTAAAH